MRQYELTTSETGFDMPSPVYAKNKKAALVFIKSRLKRGETILELNPVASIQTRIRYQRRR